MMQWPGGRILQRHELDAFLAQAVSSQLYEPDQLQELKVRPHSSRCVQTKRRVNMFAGISFEHFATREYLPLTANGSTVEGNKTSTNLGK